MTWSRLKHLLSGREKPDAKAPRPEWVEASDNPWGIRVLDVRPVTQTMILTSQSQENAVNAMSFGGDDGTSFIGRAPAVERVVEARLRFPIDGVLADGVLFAPREMEHKWALFHHRGEILCVRSWTRQVAAIAEVEEHGDHVELTRIHGALAAEDEPPEFTARALDYLLRSHALGLVYPAPLPAEVELTSTEAARWCLSVFGRLASYATLEEVPGREPDRPLRTHSLLHIAVARGDEAAIEAQLAAGVPIDLLAGDGLAPLHWAIAREGVAVMSLLLERGASIDAPDHRGFTPLHRAAERGHLDAARVLLERGASPRLEAEGHTPLSLAEGQGHAAIVDLLRTGS